MKTQLTAALSQKQTQNLSVRQFTSLALLRMSSLELLSQIELMRANPFLETIPAGNAQSQNDNSLSAHGTAEQQTPADPLSFPVSGEIPDNPFENVANTVSFREELLSDARCLPVSDRLQALVTCLIEELDDRGLLVTPLKALITSYTPLLEENGISDVSLAEWQEALHILRTLEPAGIGAGSLTESLLLQVQRLLENGEIPRKTTDLLCTLIRHYLQKVAVNDQTALLHIAHGDSVLLTQALAVLKRLNPLPVIPGAADFSLYIVPDILIQENNGICRAILNPAAQPRFRLRQGHALNAVKESLPKVEGRALRAEAEQFLQNLEARNTTLQRVADAITVIQQAYFLSADAPLSRMPFNQIAQQLNLAVSTVSRAVAEKYVQCCHGTVPLRSLFSSSSFQSDISDEWSTDMLQNAILEMVRAESPRSPLSDTEIHRRLTASGLVIARRTVAKYRTRLNIPPVSLRKDFS